MNFVKTIKLIMIYFLRNYCKENNKMACFLTPQICLNGHIINSKTELQPEYNKNFCSQCGSPTTTKCEYCNTNIQGRYYDEEDCFISTYEIKEAPAYCHSCGKPYPWTESHLKAITELIDIDEQLQESDKIIIKEVLPDLLVETSKTQVAVAKFKLIMRKAGKVTFDAVKEITIGIVSEALRKSLFGA